MIRLIGLASLTQIKLVGESIGNELYCISKYFPVIKDGYFEPVYWNGGCLIMITRAEQAE
jgi:hypothetical protein